MHSTREQEASSSTLCDCEAGGAPDQAARRRLEMILPALLWLLHCAGNFWWLKVDTRPPFSDMAGHAIFTLRIATWPWRQLIAEGRLIEWLLGVQPYPPFFYVSALPFVWFVWPTTDAMLAVNALYFGLLIFSTYGIGRLAVGRQAGLLAAFLVSMYPILYGLSRLYLVDLALTAMTAFAVFCLFWSDSFRRRGPALLLGAAIGVGVLCKWTFAVFLVGPLAVAVYLTLRHATRARLINLFAAGALALLIGLPWYLYNLEPLREFLAFNRFQAAPKEGEVAVWTLASWLTYLRDLLNQQLLLPFALLFALGTVLALRRCHFNSYLLMLLLWIVAGYVASTLFINKDTRYTMPYLPALALLSAIGFVQIRGLLLRRVGLALIVTYALVQYAGLTFGLSSYLPGLPTHIYWPLGQMPVTFYAETVHVASPPRAENWQLDQILAKLMDDVAGRNELEHPIQLLVVPTTDSFDAQTFTYGVWRDRLPLEVSLVTGILEVDSESTLQRSDYVVTKSGDVGWDFVLQDAERITMELLDADSALRAEFELLAEFPLPDGSMAQLFRHHKVLEPQ